MKKLVLLMCVLLVVSFVNAADIRYMGNGAWEDVDTSNGNGWQSGVLPGTADNARFNWGNNTVTLNYAAPNINGIQAGVDESGTLEINDGGILTAIGNSKVGNNGSCTGRLIINEGGVMNNNGWFMVAGNSNVTGVLTINGGTLNANGHLWTATGANSTATITINAGGVLNVGGMIGLGTVNASTPGGGNASLTVNDGGLLALSNIHGAGTSVFPGSMFYLNGSGMITLPGDFTGVMNTRYIPSYITGNGILGNVQANFVDGITYVTAIPEPATMALLGLGGIALLRKKRLCS